MKVTLAKTAGFCMGVRRAVEMVIDTANRAGEPVYTYGPLIHNPQVMEILREKGVSVLEEIPETGRGTVLIRAHGVTPGVKERLVAAGFDVLDATCPRVTKVQVLIRRHVEKGYLPIIAGDADHPEVTGLLGHSGGKGVVVSAPEDVDRLPDADKVLVVAQTTQDMAGFDRIRERIVERWPDARVHNTICDSTRKRQEEALAMAGDVDVMIVVGGKNSGNTQRLAQVAARSGVPTYHVETAEEIDPADVARARRVGVTAGASTPNWIIRAVRRGLEHPAHLKGDWRGTAFSVQRFLVITNLYVGLAAAALAGASAMYMGASPRLPAVVIAFCYVLSMHIANNFIGANAIRYNDPDRAHFYDRHRVPLLALAVVAGVAAVLTGTMLGTAPFLILLVMMTLGLLYNVRIVPARFGSRYIRIRAIPGSKAVLIAVAWGVVCALLPALALPGPLTPLQVYVFVWATSMVFVRSAFFDVLDVQVDRMVGQETFATWLGEVSTRRILAGVIIALFLAELAGAAAGFTPGLGYWLLPCPVIYAAIIRAHRLDILHPGYRLEFLVETNIVLAGVIALFRGLLA
ncbi:MAG: 4-hydroxy-3-methylbut-2-enyl diphosphate reductase [Desulfatibacillaceae bacterium]